MIIIRSGKKRGNFKKKYSMFRTGVLFKIVSVPDQPKSNSAVRGICGIIDQCHVLYGNLFEIFFNQFEDFNAWVEFDEKIGEHGAALNRYFNSVISQFFCRYIQNVAARHKVLAKLEIVEIASYKKAWESFATQAVSEAIKQQELMNKIFSLFEGARSAMNLGIVYANTTVDQILRLGVDEFCSSSRFNLRKLKGFFVEFWQEIDDWTQRRAVKDLLLCEKLAFLSFKDDHYYDLNQLSLTYVRNMDFTHVDPSVDFLSARIHRLVSMLNHVRTLVSPSVTDRFSKQISEVLEHVLTGSDFFSSESFSEEGDLTLTQASSSEESDAVSLDVEEPQAEGVAMVEDVDSKPIQPPSESDQLVFCQVSDSRAGDALIDLSKVGSGSKIVTDLLESVVSRSSNDAESRSQPMPSRIHDSLLVESKNKFCKSGRIKMKDLFAKFRDLGVVFKKGGRHPYMVSPDGSRHTLLNRHGKADSKLCPAWLQKQLVV